MTLFTDESVSKETLNIRELRSISDLLKLAENIASLDIVSTQDPLYFYVPNSIADQTGYCLVALHNIAAEINDTQENLELDYSQLRNQLKQSNPRDPSLLSFKSDGAWNFRHTVGHRNLNVYPFVLDLWNNYQCID